MPECPPCCDGLWAAIEDDAVIVDEGDAGMADEADAWATGPAMAVPIWDSMSDG